MNKHSSTLIRAFFDHNLLKRLKYLSIDTGVPVQQLLVEGALLLLRYHQRTDGLPAPMAPCPPGEVPGLQDKPASKPAGKVRGTKS